MGNGRRILVIENHADAGEALCAVLETRGHLTTLAVSGQRGIECAVRGLPDVIVLDLGLADMDGRKVVQLIRATRKGDEPLIIAYSGYHGLEWEALKAGCDAFVLKPEVEELESLVGLSRAEVRKYAAFAGSATTRRRR